MSIAVPSLRLWNCLLCSITVALEHWGRCFRESSHLIIVHICCILGTVSPVLPLVPFLNMFFRQACLPCIRHYARYLDFRMNMKGYIFCSIDKCQWDRLTHLLSPWTSVAGTFLTAPCSWFFRFSPQRVKFFFLSSHKFLSLNVSACLLPLLPVNSGHKVQ